MMDQLPFSVFWDKGNTVIIAWDWVSEAVTGPKVKSVHFFAELPNLPPGLGGNADGNDFEAFSYLTSVFVERTDSGLQYFFSGETVINTVHALIEYFDGQFVEHVFTYQTSNGGNQQSGDQQTGDYFPLKSLNMHLGLIEYVADPGKLWPLVKLQSDLASPDEKLPGEVARWIRELSNNQPLVRHCYTLSSEGMSQAGSQSSPGHEAHTALRLSHPVEDLEIRSCFIHSRRPLGGARKPDLSAVQRSFEKDDRLSLLLRLEGRLQMLSADWLDRIAVFAIHDSWLRSRNAFKQTKGNSNQVFDSLLANLREFLDEEWIRENLFPPNADAGGQKDHHDHISVLTLAELVELDEGAILPRPGQDFLQLDISRAFGALAAGDRFGIVGNRNIKQVLSWGGNSSRLMHSRQGIENPAACFRLLSNGIVECTGAEANNDEIHFARRKADSKVNAGISRWNSAYSGNQTFSIRLPIFQEARELAQGFNLISEAYSLVCDFPAPSESEIAGSSLLEVISYLSLLEVAEASSQQYQKRMAVGDLARHKKSGGVEHALVSLGYALNEKYVGQVGRGSLNTWSLVMAELGISSSEAAAFRGWDKLSVAEFVSLIEDPDNRAAIVAARLLPTPGVKFDAGQYLKKCRNFRIRLGKADYEPAIAWGLEQAPKSEGHKLASSLEGSVKGADGWLQTGVHDDLERLYFLSTERQRETIDKVRAGLEKLGGKAGLAVGGSTPTSGKDDPQAQAKQWYQKLVEIGEQFDQEVSGIFDGPDNQEIGSQTWRLIATQLQEHFIKKTLPQQIGSLIGDVEKWAGAVDLVGRFQRNKAHGLEDRHLHDRIFGLLRRIPNSSPAQSGLWFEGASKLQNLDTHIQGEVGRIFGAASLLDLPENLPDRDAVLTYCRVLVCHRVTKDLDTVTASIEEAALELGKAGKLTQEISQQLLAVRWLRNALPQSLGKMYSHCETALAELAAVPASAKSGKVKGLANYDLDFSSLSRAEKQS
ncbi:MAG: hypothetical protein R3D32_01265 [Nitratireductor sp.]